MLPARQERLEIARLFSFLLQGELLAMDCAKSQSEFFSDPLCQRFFKAQAKQESVHAKIFKAGIGVLSPRGTGEAPGTKELGAYRRLLESAIARQDKAESLLGMQFLLEGMGEICLKRINSGMTTRELSFHRIRQLVVGQEDAHHLFGVRQFTLLMEQTPEDWQRMRTQTGLYLEILHSLLLSLSPLFSSFDEDPEEYMQELIVSLPQELHGQAT